MGTGDVRYAKAFVDDEQVPFPVVVDDEGEAADTASVTKGSLLQMMGPKALAGSLRAFRGGHRQKKTGARPTQLGATFVIGPNNSVRYEHRDKDVSDHAPVQEVLAAL